MKKCGRASAVVGRGPTELCNRCARLTSTARNAIQVRIFVCNTNEFIKKTHTHTRQTASRGEEKNGQHMASRHQEADKKLRSKGKITHFARSVGRLLQQRGVTRNGQAENLLALERRRPVSTAVHPLQRDTDTGAQSAADKSSSNLSALVFRGSTLADCIILSCPSYRCQPNSPDTPSSLRPLARTALSPLP